MADVTRLLDAAATGDSKAAADLLPLVYDELRKLAAARLAAESPGQTLEATALVREAYVRLMGGDPAQPWTGRGHFFAAAAEAMRRIFVDSARRKQAVKHGGGRGRRELDPDAAAAPAVPEADVDLVALDAALTRLAGQDPVKAKLVELRFFAGLTGEQAAAALGMSPSAADRLWVFTRAWLRHELGFGGEG
jgi:RNA polymerase sigma factor (TIGR02999 family)